MISASSGRGAFNPSSFKSVGFPSLRFDVFKLFLFQGIRIQIHNFQSRKMSREIAERHPKFTVMVES